MGSAADRMKKMGDRLQERTKESYDRKDEYGSSFTYFKKDGVVKTANGKEIEIKDISFWRPKVGIHVFDIVPTFAGANWPLDNHGVKLPEGEPIYVLDILVHQNVGPNDAQFVCLSRNFGQPCPICEHQMELKKAVDYDADLVKSLYPKRRNIYNIVSFSSAEEEDKGVQIFECAQFFMEAKLTPLAFDARTKALIPYAHYEKGKTIQFEIKKKNYNIGERQIAGSDYVGHKLLDRDYQLDDVDMDDAYILDDLIYIPTYEEVFKAYWAGIKELPDQQKAEDNVSGRRRKTSTSSEPVQEQTATVVESTGRRTRQQVQTDHSSTNEGSTISNCPQNGKFGEDIDQLEGCNSCEIYDKCALRVEELKEKASSQNTGISQTSNTIGGRLRRRPGV